MYSLTSLCMCIYVFPAGFMLGLVMVVCLTVCVITGKKIEQTGGPKAFLGLAIVWPKLVDNLARI